MLHCRHLPARLFYGYTAPQLWAAASMLPTAALAPSPIARLNGARKLMVLAVG